MRTFEMALRDHLENLPNVCGGLLLGELSLFDNPSKELASAAAFHHDVHRLSIFKHFVEMHDIGLVFEFRHDFHLAPHVLNRLLAREDLLLDGLHGVVCLVRGRVHAPCEQRDTELATSEFRTKLRTFIIE